MVESLPFLCGNTRIVSLDIVLGCGELFESQCRNFAGAHIILLFELEYRDRYVAVKFIQVVEFAVDEEVILIFSLTRWSSMISSLKQRRRKDEVGVGLSVDIAFRILLIVDFTGGGELNDRTCGKRFDGCERSSRALRGSAVNLFVDLAGIRIVKLVRITEFVFAYLDPGEAVLTMRMSDFLVEVFDSNSISPSTSA